MPHSPQVQARLQALVPEATVVPRVYLQGLLTSPDGSVGVALSAVDPVLEPRVNDVPAKLVAGEYLDGDPNAIVLGTTLAETLGVALGDKLVLMVQHGGDIESRLLHVRGLFRYGIDEIDGFYAQIHICTAQALLGLGEDVTQLSLHLPSARDVDAVQARVSAAMAGDPLEVLPWPEALPDLYMWVVLDEAGMFVFVLIIAVIVAMGILNTVLMSVFERMRELGVMLALGMSPLRLAALVLTEGLLLGLFSTAIGLVLGLLGSWPLAVYGFDYAEIAGESLKSMEAAGVAFESLVYADLSAYKVAIFCALTAAMTQLAALYPAWKAATLRPIAGLQHH